MDDVLNEVKKKHCKTCFVGTPYKLLHYDSSGTCMDYIYDQMNVPFSFAWEIYTNESVFQEMQDYIREQTLKNSKSKSFLQLDTVENYTTEVDSLALNGFENLKYEDVTVRLLIK